MRATVECRSGNSATPAFYIGPNVIECTTPWHEVSRLVELGIGSSESKDVSIIEFEFLNPFELSSIRPDSGSVKGGKFVSVHEKSNNLVAFKGLLACDNSSQLFNYFFLTTCRLNTTLHHDEEIIYCT